MKELVGKNNKAVAAIRSIAHKFDEVLANELVGVPLRAQIWSDPGSQDIINIKILASKEDGNFVAYKGYYDNNSENKDRLSFNSKLGKAFLSANSYYRFQDAFIKFVEDILSIFEVPIYMIFLDMGGVRYNSIQYEKSSAEEGSINLYIHSYSEDAKDNYGFVTAKGIVGKELATF